MVREGLTGCVASLYTASMFCVRALGHRASAVIAGQKQELLCSNGRRLLAAACDGGWKGLYWPECPASYLCAWVERLIRPPIRRPARMTSHGDRPTLTHSGLTPASKGFLHACKITALHLPSVPRPCWPAGPRALLLPQACLSTRPRVPGPDAASAGTPAP